MLWLVGQIIDHSNPQDETVNYFPGDDLFTPGHRRRGIPIGSQTRQFFANFYLDPFDRFVKDRLRIRGYVRNIDDLLVFTDDNRFLPDARQQIKEFLVRLGLPLHPRKSVIFVVQGGIRFLGHRVFSSHRRLPKEDVRRFQRRECADEPQQQLRFLSSEYLAKPESAGCDLRSVPRCKLHRGPVSGRP